MAQPKTSFTQHKISEAKKLLSSLGLKVEGHAEEVLERSLQEIAVSAIDDYRKSIQELSYQLEKEIKA